MTDAADDDMYGSQSDGSSYGSDSDAGPDDVSGSAGSASDVDGDVAAPAVPSPPPPAPTKPPVPPSPVKEKQSKVVRVLAPMFDSRPPTIMVDYPAFLGIGKREVDGGTEGCCMCATKVLSFVCALVPCVVIGVRGVPQRVDCPAPPHHPPQM